MSKSMDISRRGFIGSVAGVGALAALGLTGCAPKTASEAEPMAETGEAAEGAKTGADWLGSAPEIAESDIVETRDCDLLIVGAGNGGMAAAAYAADQGVDFIICEKGETVGATRHWFAALGTRPFKELGVEVDRQRLMGEIVRYSQGNCDQRLIRMWMDESNDMFEFVDGIMTAADAVVIADEFDMPGGMGGTPCEHHYGDKNGGRDIEERNVLFEKHINEAGKEVTFGHELAKLVREEGGRVTGAIFNTADGYVQINAAKGVLLTTGGYSANPDMLTALSPVTVQSVTALGYNQNNTGGGIKAALWAGAAKDLTSATMIFDRGLVAPGTVAGYTEESIEAGMPQFPGNGQFNPGTQPFLKVNMNGERFANESADYDYLPHAAAQQPGGTYVSAATMAAALGGIMGSGSGAVGIIAQNFLEPYLATGVDPAALAKIIATSATIGGALPNSGAMFGMLAAMGLNHKNSYKHIAAISIGAGMCALVVMIIMANVGIY